MNEFELSRRQAVGLVGGALMAATALGPAAAASASRPIGIALYSLREPLEADLPATLRRLRKIGYRTVEVVSLYGRTVSELRGEFDRAGLTCPSVQFLPSVSLSSGVPSLADVPRAAAFARDLGARNVVCAAIPHGPAANLTVGSPAFLDHIVKEARSKSLSDWQRMAADFEHLGERFAAEGLRFGFHNHNLELGELSTGERPLEILMRETDPAHVAFELDVGWVMAAGLDPVDLLKQGKGRISQVHLKDIAPTRPNTSLQMEPADMGEGGGDWPAIFSEIGQQPAIENLYIEREPPFSRQPLDIITDAYSFVRRFWR